MAPAHACHWAHPTPPAPAHVPLPPCRRAAAQGAGRAAPADCEAAAGARGRHAGGAWGGARGHPRGAAGGPSVRLQRRPHCACLSGSQRACKLGLSGFAAPPTSHRLLLAAGLGALAQPPPAARRPSRSRVPARPAPPPQGRCWVEGDNAAESLDSRSAYGPVRGREGGLACSKTGQRLNWIVPRGFVEGAGPTALPRLTRPGCWPYPMPPPARCTWVCWRGASPASCGRPTAPAASRRPAPLGGCCTAPARARATCCDVSPHYSALSPARFFGGRPCACACWRSGPAGPSWAPPAGCPAARGAMHLLLAKPPSIAPARQFATKQGLASSARRSRTRRPAPAAASGTFFGSRRFCARCGSHREPHWPVMCSQPNSIQPDVTRGCTFGRSGAGQCSRAHGGTRDTWALRAIFVGRTAPFGPPLGVAPLWGSARQLCSEARF